MINNRLFKKINSIFWGILSWFPLVYCILMFFKTQVSFTVVSDYQEYFYICLDSFVSFFADNVDGYLSNPLTRYFIDFLELFYGSVYPNMLDCLCCVCSWVCWVQVMRLLVYVFYWFIDLISGLFDYLSLNRKGDN